MTIEKIPKPWYKKWYAMILFAFLGLILINSLIDNDKSAIQPSTSINQEQEAESDTVNENPNNNEPALSRSNQNANDAGNINNSPEIEIKKIIGKPIGEVEKIIGMADSVTAADPSSTECKANPCERAMFQSGKYEILFIDKKADWVTINQVSNYDFDKSSLKYLGLPQISPTFENPLMVMKWNNIEGIYEVNFFNNGQNKIDYIYIKNITK